MSDEPEMYVFDPSDLPGAQERRAEIARAKAESRRRYREHLATALDLHGVAGDVAEIADVALDALTRWIRIGSDDECGCSCHPRLPDGDLHDFGFACNCRKTPEERRLDRVTWLDSMQAYWDSPEGKAAEAAHEVEENELRDWLAEQDGVEVTSHGGWAPEQWEGVVDGHSFYFRERHGQWSLELDLRPNGHFANAVRGTDEHGEMILEPVEMTAGDVIAEGTIREPRYGQTPRERAIFLVNRIRTHLGHLTCTVHAQDLSVLAAALGADIDWCPACGERLSGPTSR